MKRVLTFAAIAEIGTAVLALAVPETLARLLLGAELSEAGVVAMRCFGLAILALGLACWPSPDSGRTPWRGMLAYNVLISAYLAIVGASAGATGVLLWPVVAIHALIALLLAITGRTRSS